MAIEPISVGLTRRLQITGLRCEKTDPVYQVIELLRVGIIRLELGASAGCRKDRC